MAVVPACFVLFLLCNGIAGHSSEEANGLFWPSEYHFKGEEIDFLAKYTRPFEMWYSSSMNRSRKDYNGGTDKKYYYGGEEGYILNVHPISDIHLDSVMVCIGENTTTPQEDFLPENPYNFLFIGKESLNDRDVDVWKHNYEEHNRFRIDIMVYAYKNENEDDIPVRQDFKKFNLKRGAMIVHVITDYYNFQDTFSEDKLEYAEFNKHCYFPPNNPDEKMYHPKEIKDFSDPEVLLELDVAFDKYTKHHKKSYSENEHEMRKIIFEKNLRQVQEVNKQNLSYKLTLNQFSDRTQEELRYLTGTTPTDLRNLQASPFPHSLGEIELLSEELPDTFDLRMEGVITPIRNQGDCGSCWAFSTTAAVEGAIARANGGNLLDLSEQSVIDCAWGYDNKGCRSGTLDGAFKYVAAYGIPTEEEYGEYMELEGTCNVLNMSTTYMIRGFAMVTPRHPNALKLALYKYGPVAVAIHASDQMTQYSNGVFYDFTCEGKAPNHGVTVVGYGVRDGDEYWIVKNSWGELWGEDGYILMANKNDNCFLLDYPFYPIV